MFEKKHCILCNVSSCKYFDNQKCTADDVVVSLDNSVIANTDHETKCHTFKCRNCK